MQEVRGFRPKGQEGHIQVGGTERSSILRRGWSWRGEEGGQRSEVRQERGGGRSEVRQELGTVGRGRHPDLQSLEITGSGEPRGVGWGQPPAKT